MDYKLVAIDMDGTLLNSNDNVSEKTKKVLNKAIDRGVNIVLSTGRIHRSALHYGHFIGLKSPIIACNGAIISSYQGKEIIYENHIDSNVLKDIIEIAESNNMYYHFYDLSAFYFKKANNEFEKYHKYYEENFVKQGIKVIGFNNPMEIINANSNYYKLVFIEDDSEKLQHLRQELEKKKGISVSKSWHNNLEVMKEGVSKGDAVRYLAKMLNIDTEEIVAIGDNENDISMFKVAGLAVAMGNGDDIIKEHANVITDTNDNDGVAKAIEKYVLKC